nr:hypothetical protein [Streptomyces sp. DSM 41633]
LPAARIALEKIEKPVAAMVATGLTARQAFDTYTAISVLVRSSAVLQRLQSRTDDIRFPREYWEQVIDAEAMPLIASIPGRGYRIGVADDINFDHILDSILDRAESFCAEGA